MTTHRVPSKWVGGDGTLINWQLVHVGFVKWVSLCIDVGLCSFFFNDNLTVIVFCFL